MLKERLNNCACFASPLIVAVVIVTGLVSLSLNNMAGRPLNQVASDHSTAVHNLMFRR